MFLLTGVIGAALFLCVILLYFLLYFRRGKPETPGNSAMQLDATRRASSGRHQFVFSMILGYFATALIVTLIMVVATGLDGLEVGLFLSLGGMIYAVPIALVGAIVGYPAFRATTRKSNNGFVIWIGYSIASIVSAIMVVVVGSFVFPGEELMPNFGLLLVGASLIVAAPSSAIGCWLGRDRSAQR